MDGRSILWVYFIVVAVSFGNASQEPSESASKRQISPIQTQTPLLPPSFGGALGNFVPAILPIVLILGLGAFLMPALGILLFGSSGGLGGLFDGFSKKRSFNLKDNSLFSTEKMTELLQTVTKAIEEASKES